MFSRIIFASLLVFISTMVFASNSDLSQRAYRLSERLYHLRQSDHNQYCVFELRQSYKLAKYAGDYYTTDLYFGAKHMMLAVLDTLKQLETKTCTTQAQIVEYRIETQAILDLTPETTHQSS